MSEMVKVSFDEAQRRELKRRIIGDKPYLDRASLGFAAQLFLAMKELREASHILDVIDGLEGLRPPSGQRKESQFKHGPLHPLWHIHWTAPRHIVPNLGIHWNLEGKGSRDPLTPMLQEVVRDFGGDPDLWPKKVAHRFAIDGLNQRARRGLTGDWIIFGKHQGYNYYLGLATHKQGEGSNASRLYTKLQQGSAAEFPFLF